MDKPNEITKVKMSGYLHFKSKKRMISSWKNYWFVLEDRLLLYYRSKVEYEAISPCKGSINLGPPCTVKSLPSATNSFQIETRSVTYTLKADDSDHLKKWMQAILSALNQNQNFNPDATKRLSHFRYSLDDLVPKKEPNDPQKPFKRQNTMPGTKNNDEIIQSIKKIGAYTYGDSLGTITKIASKKIGEDPKKSSQGSLPDCVLRDGDRYWGENIYERISGEFRVSQGSFLVDNQNYSECLRKAVPEQKGVDKSKKLPLERENKSLLVENDTYQSTGTRQAQSEEVIYAEPKIDTDVNKNSVVIENSFYAGADVISVENLYEDLDKFNLYSRPDEISSQSSFQVKEKKKSLKKSKSFIKRVWKKKKKSKNKTNSKKKNKNKRDLEEEIYAEVDPICEEEKIYTEVDPISVEKSGMSDESAVQMLTELHNILENKKNKSKATSSTNSESEKIKELPAILSPQNSECPELPPKTLKPATNDSQPEEFRSLDEILEDLDKEKIEAKGKVQVLIEKFSESEDDVVLRKHEQCDPKNYRHSDELNTLLNELAKVTSAPILTPGVTSSLVNPDLTNEEWLKLLPVRQRRLSEPDYDVPRPHKSIQLPVKAEESDAIPVTRFFGPVLPPQITDNKEESLCVSMTPDSLEIDQKRHPLPSYTSHNYFNEVDLPQISPMENNDKIIYAMPKTYLSVATRVVNTCPNLCGGQNEECTIVYKNVNNLEVREEIFRDSLELCETATEF